MDRVASPHDAGGVGAPVHDTDAAAVEKKVPELTLDRTVVLLEAGLEEPEMRLARATALVQYYIIRNRVARQSHERTWWKKHEGVNFLLL